MVLNQLWRFTQLQSSFGCNMIALNGGRPEMMTLRDILVAFIDFRESVVTRRTKFRLRKARDAAHVQVGLAIAVANIDEVIRLIRTSADAGTAREALMVRAWPARDMAPLITLIADPRHTLDEDGNYRLSEAQSRAILELRLARLTALGRDEIAEQLNKLADVVYDRAEQGSLKRFIRANREFHAAIAKASGNERLHHLLVRQIDELERFFYLGARLRDVSGETQSDHHAIVEVLKARDPVEARQIMIRHNDLTRQGLLRSLASSPNFAQINL